MERTTPDTKETCPVQSPCRVVTSVTHDSQSPGFSVKRKQVRITNYTGLPINCELYFFFNLKLLILPKKYALFKTFPKIYYSFFSSKIVIGHTYICTICNDNFKFTLYLKLNGAKTFIAVPPNACLFSITRFLYG